ncbi:MAG: N-acetylmuramoyl-L-alanine amidase [Sphaerospermopsis sp. SIO1G2]|nr:N-acetylmuramoyl-L-alanine amidase [Sphaerospermopsis sp. SIO1G2]
MVNEKNVFIRYSPNHNERPPVPVELLVFHYTGMIDGTSALERLCDGDSQVSAHYMVEGDGQICLLVEEDRRAWHAGVGQWQSWDNINDISIGIEIVNPGHEHGYRAFPHVQMEAVLGLARDIMQRHDLCAHAVVGHSDIAPMRKQDPGELFPWQWFAQHGVGVWHDVAPYIKDALESCVMTPEEIQALRAVGYGIEASAAPEQLSAVMAAFQRRFRPHLVSGYWDNECRACLDGLVNQKNNPLLKGGLG